MKSFSDTGLSAVAPAVLLLSLVSVSRSVPQACKDLLRHLGQTDLHGLEGRRSMIAGTLSNLTFIERLRQRDSATAEFSSISGGSSISFRRSSRSGSSCRYASYSVNLEGGNFTFDDGNVTTTFIHTSCRDCILLKFNVESEKRPHFYLFSKRRQLDEMELGEFRVQAECLSLPPPVVMDPTKELCPEQH